MADVSTNYVMKVSANGQISIPADARARWKSEKMIVVDLGDRIVVRPMPAEPVRELIGKYRRGPSTDESRRTERRAEAGRERRKKR